MKKENEILINDLNNKEKKLQDLIEEKMKLKKDSEEFKKINNIKLNELNNNFKNLEKENENLNKQLLEIVDLTGNKFEILNEQILKSNEKINSLIDIYNKHFNF